MSIFESELGDSRFVELAQTFRDHALILVFGRLGQWEIKTELTPEVECDAAVFRGVRGGKETTVIAILHVFAIGFQDARVCARLREDFAKHL